MTPSELHVAQLAAEGFSNADIARVRGTSIRTVANQMASVLRQVGAASRRHIAILTGIGAVQAPAPVVDWAGLSPRDRTLVAMACSGTPQKVIALELGISQSTVSEALRATRERLGFRGFTELALAYRSGLDG